VSTEEDGVDEAGRTTRPPLIMAPPGLEADPDGEAMDAVVDNGIMARSRKRTGESPSGAAQWGNGANGDSSDDGDAATPAGAETAEDAASDAAVPLPADTISTVKAAPAAQASAWRAAATAAEPAGADAATYSAPTYSGMSGPAAPQPGYQRPDWSAGPDGTPPAVDPSGNGHRPPDGSPAATATAAAGGADAGLASSVASAWQKRGGSSSSKGQRGGAVRRSPKRQAMLTLARVEPWSVMKFSFVASVVAFVILFVAVALLYLVLAALGVFDSLQHTVSSITSSQNSAGTNISHWFSASLILGWTALLGALNIVLITAMATVGSVIYNLIAKTIGGIEVTLRETE
jgi:transmembrane protein DUF3566